MKLVLICYLDEGQDSNGVRNYKRKLDVEMEIGELRSMRGTALDEAFQSMA